MANGAPSFCLLLFVYKGGTCFLALQGRLRDPKDKGTVLSPVCVSVQSFSRVWLQPHGLQHSRLPCPSPTPGAGSNLCPSSQWCHPTISSSVVPFSFLQCFPASGAFPVNQLFVSDGQSIGVSASTSVLPVNIQDWFPLGWTGWISLQFKGLSRVFSKTTVQKYQFFSAQLFHSPTLTSNHDYWKNYSLD